MRYANSSASSLPGHPDSWSYIARLTEDVATPITRGRVVGGSSAVNGAQFMRAVPDYYDEWASLGCAKWSFHEVLPHFRAIEADLDFGATSLHGADGPIRVQRTTRSELAPVASAFAEAAIDAGHPWVEDLNGADSAGVGALPLNIVDGIRQNAGAAFVEPVAERPNLYILDQTRVNRVLSQDNSVVGVAVQRGTESATINADQVVLSAGALNSPQLLMLSGIGPGSLLHAHGVGVVVDNDAVGRNLMDHAAIALPFAVRADFRTPYSHPVAEVSLHYASDRHAGPGEDMRMFPYLHSMRTMLTRTGPSRGHLKDAIDSVRGFHPVRALGSLRGTSLSTMRHQYRHRNDLAIHCAIGAPASRGRLAIDSADPEAPPVLEYRYLSDPEDRSRLCGAVRLAVELLHHRSFGAIGALPTADVDLRRADGRELDVWIRSNITTAFHSVGTARMGSANDDKAVVDQYCRVRGMQGLRVVDLSVLPLLMTRGPNATAVMLGHRAAALIDQFDP
jgi:choline dehydrogenase-like flavoprotein